MSEQGQQLCLRREPTLSELAIRRRQNVMLLAFRGFPSSVARRWPAAAATYRSMSCSSGSNSVT